MKLYYYKAPLGNFGDDLNPWLWPRLLPDIFDDDGRVSSALLREYPRDTFSRNLELLCYPESAQKPGISRGKVRGL